MESAALSRANQPPTARGPTHHLLLDEFSQFTAQSEQALTRMLSETRKYGLFVVMAHQTWSQADERLRGALQNVNVEVIFKTGRMDAEYSARLLGSVNPLEIKHTVANEQAEARTHPTYFTLAEQWERHVQAIQQLPPGHAFVRMPDDRVYRVRTRTLPHLTRRSYDLEVVKQEYLQRYFTPPSTASAPAAATTALPAGTPGSSPPAHPMLPVPPSRQVIGRRSPRRAQPGTRAHPLFVRDHSEADAA